MTPIPRPCLRCGALTTAGSRCPSCAAASRPTFRQRRGMGSWEWAKLRAAILARDGGCQRCGATVGLEVHHVVPLARGGSNAPDNLVTLCGDCHRGAHRALFDS